MPWPYCRNRFRENLMPDQLAPDGSFPLELARTKPYSYSLFDLDILAVVCQIVSTDDSSPTISGSFALPNGNAHTRRPSTSASPSSQDKSKWPFPKDVEYFDDLPNRQPSLLFAGIAYNQPQYIALWRKLPPDPKTAEIIRNFPIRQPILWITPSSVYSRPITSTVKLPGTGVGRPCGFAALGAGFAPSFADTV